MKAYLTIAIRSLIRRRKYHSSVLVLVVVSVMMFLMSTAVGNGFNAYFESVQSSLEARILLASFLKTDEQGIKRLYDYGVNHDHIVQLEPFREVIFFEVDFDNTANGMLNSRLGTRADDGLYESYVIEGRSFQQGDTQVAIVPKQFDPTGRTAFNHWQDASDVVFWDGSTWLGQWIQGSFVGFEGDVMTYEFEVIGVYDIIPNGDPANQILISYDDYDQIAVLYEQADSVGVTYQITIREGVAIDSVIEDLRRNGIDARAKFQFNTLPDIIMAVTLLMRLLGTGLFAYVCWKLSSHLKLVIHQRRGEMAMMKAMGYNNRQLLSIFCIEYLLLDIIGLALGIILGKLTLWMINYGIHRYLSIYLRPMVASINSQLLFMVLIIGFMVPSLAIFLACIPIYTIMPKEALNDLLDLK